MSTVIIPSFCRRQLQTNQWLRNGSLPDAFRTTFLQEEANRIARLRFKSWSFACPLQSIPAAGGAPATRVRWRWAGRTSTHTRYLFVRLLMASSRNATDPYAGLSVYNPATLTTIASAEWHFGNNTTSAPDTPKFFGIGDIPTNDGTAIVEVPPDTELEFFIYDVDNARTLAACVWEVTENGDTANGYINSGLVGTQEIYDSHREELLDLIRDAWLRNGAPLWNFASNTDATAPTRASATFCNVLDTTVTTVSAASPGVTLDLTYRSTVRRAAASADCVPVRWKVNAKMNPTVGVGGTIRLKDSAGNTLASHTINSTTQQWYDTTLNLPATVAKYDLHMAGAGIQSVILYASSLYSYSA